MVHTCILAKNSHQIRNQHLRFAQDRSNDPSVAYVPLLMKLNPDGRMGSATNAMYFLEEFYSRMFCMAFSWNEI